VRYLSLFSGIEAASLAFAPLGWRAAAFCETDAFARALLKHRYPDVPNLGDVETANVESIGNVDLIVFGSPCQSFSVAGRRLGMDDARGNLALVGAQIVYRKRPRWFIFENVCGLFSSDGGSDFGTLLAAFAGYAPGSFFTAPEDGWRNSGIVGQAAADGYGLAWRVLDAQYVRVDGLERAVPQRRRRVFIVGYLGDWRRAAAVLFERESLCWDHPPRRAQGQGITHDTSGCLGASGRGVERPGETRGQDPVVAWALQERDGKGSDSSTKDGHLIVAPTLQSRGNQTGGDRPPGTDVDTADSLVVADPLQANESRTYANGGNNPRPHNVIAFDTTQITSKTNRSRPSSGHPSHALSQSSHAPAIAFSCKDHGNDVTEDIAPPLRAMNEIDGNANAGGQVAVEQRAVVRRLMPVECERLMGMPDDYTLIPYRGKPAQDGPRYKALGNSFAVNCIRWIAQRIALVDRL
jgi:DNA (cytosine-5)-methyltransferase 1